MLKCDASPKRNFDHEFELNRVIYRNWPNSLTSIQRIGIIHVNHSVAIYNLSSLISELRKFETTRPKGCKASHEEVNPREWNQGHRNVTQVFVQLTYTTQKKGRLGNRNFMYTNPEELTMKYFSIRNFIKAVGGGVPCQMSTSTQGMSNLRGVDGIGVLGGDSSLSN